MHQPEREAWDHSDALARLGGDEAVLRETAVIFLQELPDILRRLRELIRQPDCLEFNRIAHRLKGTVGCFSAESAFSAAAALEEASRQGAFARMREAEIRLEKELTRLRDSLAEYSQVLHEGAGR